MLVILATLIFVILSPVLAVVFFIMYIFGKRHVILIRWAIALLIGAKVHKIIKYKVLEDEEFNVLFVKFNRDLITKGFFAKLDSVPQQDPEEKAVHHIKLDSLENFTKENLKKDEFYVVEKHSKYIYSLIYPIDKNTKVFGELEDLFNYVKGKNILGNL